MIFWLKTKRQPVFSVFPQNDIIIGVDKVSDAVFKLSWHSRLMNSSMSGEAGVTQVLQIDTMKPLHKSLPLFIWDLNKLYIKALTSAASLSLSQESLYYRWIRLASQYLF